MSAAHICKRREGLLARLERNWRAAAWRAINLVASAEWPPRRSARLARGASRMENSRGAAARGQLRALTNERPANAADKLAGERLV